MLAVDTNALILAITGDDPAQSPVALEFIRAHSPVWVSSAVLIETIWVLESVYECAKPQIVEALNRIIKNKSLALENPQAARAALELFRSKGRLSFDDCMILEITRNAGHVLITFDKALGKVDGAQALVAV